MIFISGKVDLTWCWFDVVRYGRMSMPVWYVISGIFNNYPPKRIQVTNGGDNCFSICPVSEWIWRISVLNTLK